MNCKSYLDFPIYSINPQIEYVPVTNGIDIWMKPLEGDAVRKSIAFARIHYLGGSITYHHIDARCGSLDGAGCYH